MSAVIAALGGIRATVFASLCAVLIVASVVLSLRLGHVNREFAGYRDRVIAATAVAKDKALAAQRAAMAAVEEYRTTQKRADDAYQAGRESAAQYQANVVADLRADRIRLQNGWQSCLSRPAQVGETRSAAGVVDQTPGVPEEGFGRILRQAADADNDIKWYQQALKNTRASYNACAGVKE